MALRPQAALCVGLVLTVLLTVGYWRSTWDGAAGGPAGRPARPRISATVMPASSVRCNRINLPPQYYNATTAPYNPAAARHPGTKEWVLLHTFDEARPPGQARILKPSWALKLRACCTVCLRFLLLCHCAAPQQPSVLPAGCMEGRKSFCALRHGGGAHVPPPCKPSDP